MSHRTLYMSSNGDTWYLSLNALSQPVVVHEPNKSSSGNASSMPVGEFLMRGSHGPQHNALLDLIGGLVDSSGG